MYEAVTAAFTCGGQTFTAKGRHVLSLGWKGIDRIFCASLKEQPEDEAEPAALPDFTEGQLFDQVEAAVTEHFTAPPKAYTEDTLLAAMETAGKEEMPEDAERKGLGTPATRAAILEKHQGGDQPGHRPAGYFDLSHAHGGVGAEADRHRQG